MISHEEIEALAQLARLKLSAQEVASLQQDISNILEYVGLVSAVEPGVRDIPLLHNAMREDAPRAADDPLIDTEEAIRAQFPSRTGDYNVVRKIIQKDE